MSSYQNKGPKGPGRPRSMDKESIEQEAIAIVRKEKEKWENSEVQITERVWFPMRDLIRQCRRNYYGVFDRPVDPITGRKRLFYPLTEEMCDSVAPKIGITTKDIDFTATNPKGYITSEIARLMVRKYLKDNYVGEIQDMDSLNLAINGTTVRKTWLSKGRVKTRDVDLLNVYIDPTTPSIQEAYRFTERGVMYLDELRKTGWMNVDKACAREGVPRIDSDTRNSQSEGVPMADVWEMYGKIPKYLITGNRKDTEDVDGHLIISGLESGIPCVHVLELNRTKDKLGNVIKPYEENWYIRVPGRWYGKGVAEKLIPLQVWMNLIVNIRITRSTLSQLGLFKIRRGSNITSSQISKLGVNGAISVNSMDDIEQLVVQEASQASYTDETNIRTIAQRITSAFESVTGESLPASTPATNAVLQSRSAMGTFTKIQGRGAAFTRRWVDRQLLPKLANLLDTKEVITLFGDDERFEELIERCAVARVRDEMYASDRIPTEEAVNAAVDATMEQMRRQGTVFIEELRDLLVSAVDTRVQVDNEDLDASVVVDKLVSTLQIVPEMKSVIVTEIFNKLGLTIPNELRSTLNVPREQLATGSPMSQPPMQGMVRDTMDSLAGGLANR